MRGAVRCIGFFAAVIAFASCGVDLIGSDAAEPSLVVVDGGGGGADAPLGDVVATSSDANALSDGSSLDGGDDAGPPSKIDAGDAGGCPPLSPTPISGARKATAVRAIGTKTIDGNLNEWRKCLSLVLNLQSAAKIAPTTSATAQVYLEWDQDALYVAATITDGKLDGTNPTEPASNDSFEIFASGEATRVGNYKPLDHHYIIDHRGTAKDYSNVNVAAPFPNGVSIVIPGGYQVEARIPANELGGMLTKDKILGFDTMMNDDMLATKGYLIWAMEPHVACTTCTTDCACNFSPAYDTMTFAPLSLE
jgi:hypothetical protein